MPATKTPAPAPRSAATAGPVHVHPAIDGLDRFLSHVSHELRTPLSAILLWARLLDELGGRDPEQLQEAVNAIKTSAHELQRMVEDLIDMSRVLTGKVRIEPQPTPVEPAIEQAVAQVRALAEEHQIQITLQQDDPGLVARADPLRLNHILRNLVRHAVEVSPAGGEVMVAVQRHGREVEFAVTDSGPGLPPQLETHVFDHFGLTSGADSHPASGVALAVVRRLVELHEGRIRAHSGPKPGTTYTVWLPAERGGTSVPDPESAAALDEVPLQSRPLQGRHVLLIEDASETRKALSVILSEAGAQVTSVDSSSAALAAFKRGGLDVVVSDLGLPKMDGYEMMVQFRRWEQLDAKTPVPALALTAYAGEGTRRRAFQSGYHGCLTKPVDPARLVAALAGLLRHRSPPQTQEADRAKP